MCAALISQFFSLLFFSFLLWTKTTNIFRLPAAAGSLIKFLFLLLIFDVVLFVSSLDVIFLKQHHKKKGVWLNFFGGQAFFFKI